MRLIFLLFVSFALTACGRVGHFDLEAILKDAGFRFEVPVIFEVTDYITEAAQGAEDLADLRAYKFLLERKGKLNECSIVIFDLSSTLPTASEQTLPCPKILVQRGWQQRATGRRDLKL